MVITPTSATHTPRLKPQAAKLQPDRELFLFMKDLGHKPLRQLKVCRWYTSQNTEFVRLRAYAAPGSQRLLLRYAERFSMLGHEHNLLVRLGEEDLLWLTRPVCTQHGKNYLVLEFLRRSVRLEPFPR